MKKHVVIVAGGKGLRMGSDLPKQFMLLSGLPVLMHTIKAFFDYDNRINIVLVIPQSHLGYWNELCEKYLFTIEHSIVIGGETRFHSVKNGLESILESNESAVVAIHDAVRPLIPIDKISNSFEIASENGSAVVAVPSKDSLRKVYKGGNKAVNRSEFFIIQTPQVFKSELLRESFLVEYNECFTDDASVVEAKGFDIKLVEGSYSNIKITTPEDLIFAEAFLSKKKATDNPIA